MPHNRNVSGDRNTYARACMAAAALLAFSASGPAHAASLALEWEPATARIDETPLDAVASYRIYYGTESRVYTHRVEVASGTSATIDGLIDGQTYYFAVTTVDGFGIESAQSTELAWNSTDTDFDQLPDAWEGLKFGGIGMSAGGSQDNYDESGGSDLEEYIAGTDPVNADSEFVIELMADTGRLTVVFPATKAEGPGYENKRRMFSLEQTSGGLTNWRAVHGMPVEGQNQVERVPVEIGAELNAFRLKCWLEQTSM